MKTKLRSISIGLLMLSMTFVTAQIKDAPRKTPDYQNLKPVKNKLCNASNVHKNFKDIVAWFDRTDERTSFNYLVQVTTINPGREGQGSNNPTHYFTAWSTGSTSLIHDNCSISALNQITFFSDRNTFKGKTDKVSYVFDLKANSVAVTLNSWGNGRTVYRDLKRVQNTIYYVGNDGAILVFNLFPQVVPIIQ